LNDDFANEVYGIHHTMGIDQFYNNLTETKQEVKLFPNPVSNRLFIGLKHFENTEVLIELFDVAGNLVENQKLGIQNVFETLEFKNIEALNKGMYLVHVSNQSFSNYYKIIAE